MRWEPRRVEGLVVASLVLGVHHSAHVVGGRVDPLESSLVPKSERVKLVGQVIDPLLHIILKRIMRIERSIERVITSELRWRWIRLVDWRCMERALVSTARLGWLRLDSMRAQNVVVRRAGRTRV